MKILFVTMVALETNSSATIQNKGIIRGLSALGNNVDVMTLRQNCNAINFDDSMNDINESINNSYYIEPNRKYSFLMAKNRNYGKKNIEINRRSNLIKTIFNKWRNFLKNVHNNISIFDAQKVNVKEVSKVNINYNEYDVIISASDPKSSHLIVERILRYNNNCKAKWIQYWGDPMLNDITRKSGWKDAFVKYHENKLISKANKIVYASPLTLKIQKETFPLYSYKMDYASQACVNVKDEINRVEKIKKKDGLITVGYYGAYQSSVRNIIPLYNAAKEGSFKLFVCGKTDITLKGTEFVTIKGMLSYKEVVKMEEETDILVCICNKKGTQIPGKIYYCTSYKKPIIVILDSEYNDELKKYFKRFDRFILCNNDEKSIINAIEKARLKIIENDFKISEELTPEFMAKQILMNL